jgi:integrase
LAAEAKRRIRSSTISRRLAAIRYAHRLADHPSPTSSEAVKATLRGIKRKIGRAPKQKAPATSDKIAAMAAVTGDTMKGRRDRALLLLGFAGAFRRSELVALDVGDLKFVQAGVRVTIRKSKTDQEGPRCDHCHRTRLVCLSDQSDPRLDPIGWHYAWAGIPADQQGRQGP